MIKFIQMYGVFDKYNFMSKDFHLPTNPAKIFSSILELNKQLISKNIGFVTIKIKS